MSGHGRGDEGGATLCEQVTQLGDVREHGVDLGGLAVNLGDDATLLIKSGHIYFLEPHPHRRDTRLCG